MRFALLIGCLVVGLTPSALQAAGPDKPAVTIELASTFPGSMPILGNAAHNLSEKVRRASAGEVKIRFFEPGVLVPGADTVNAVSEGRVAAAWAGPGWFAGHDSAFNFFSSVPFGPGVEEYLAWMYQGGGLDLARDMFRRYDVHNIPCGLIPAEASGWFRKEIRSVDDLKGLRMRFFGLGAKVMQKLGVETVQLAPGKILEALKSGALDATEFSLPAMDEPLGFQTVTKFYYFPGWHQQATLFDLDINQAVWDGLRDSHKAIIELACSQVLVEMLAEGAASQSRAIRDMQAAGVQVRRWPPAILVAFDDAWREVVAEESASNPNFRKVYQSYAAFRESYRTWHYLSFLE